MSRINRKNDLHNQRRRLVEVAIANPLGPYHKIGDSRPIHACRSIGPSRKVRLLVAFQLRAARLESNTLELNRLLSTPSHNERTSWAFDQIRILSGRLDCIEDDLQFRRRRDADQRGLWNAVPRCAGHDSIEKSCHERVNSRYIHLNLRESNHNIMLTSVLAARKMLRIRTCLRVTCTD